MYRPDFQYSVYDFDVSEIQRHIDDNTVIDILKLTTPVITSSDKMITVFYDLLASEYNALEAFSYSGEKNDQLVLAIGETEVKVLLGANQQIKFDDLSQLSMLDVEDFLAIRLYANNDAANVLWEWAFGTVAMAVDANRDGLVEFNARTELNDNPDIEPRVITDVTTSDKPFRFWLNNDYDVVYHSGEEEVAKTGLKHCESRSEWVFDLNSPIQTCEQEDRAEYPPNPQKANNINDFIESERDLEDFAPLALNIAGHAEFGFDFKNYQLQMKASGFSIKLFKGVWEKGDEYVHDSVTAISQAKAEFLMHLKEGELFTIEPSIYHRMGFDDKGIAKLIFEGVSGSDDCADNQAECALEIFIINKNTSRQIAKSKIYMDLHDVRDFYEHYTVGEGYGAEPEQWGLVGPPGVRTDIFTADSADEKIDYMMFVHGWRMIYKERVSFAETTLKRMYWSGYKGRFGSFSWPTTWFEKPAHVGTVATLLYVLQDLTNYSSGEKIARQTGKELADNLLYVKNKNKSLYVLAHSMGNVVMGEALKILPPGVVDKYIATQAATSAGAYQIQQPDMNVKLFGQADDEAGVFWTTIYGLWCNPVGNMEFVAAWRCLSLVEDGGINNDYDIPPDQYRYTINPDSHGLPPDGNGITPVTYYAGIGSKTEMFNFYNPSDVALNGWRLQQVTKPDSGKTYLEASNPTTGWFYKGVKVNSDQENTGPVRDTYYRNGDVLDWSIEDERFEIMASIIPSRTAPLGSKNVCHKDYGAGEITLDKSDPDPDSRCFDLEKKLGYSKSNYDHSAQWLAAYHMRFAYWDKVCFTFWGVESSCIER